jgi:hypothetical protein
MSARTPRFLSTRLVAAVGLATVALSSGASAREYQFQLGAAETEILSDSFVIANGTSTSVTPDFGFAVEVGRGVLVGARIGGVTSPSNTRLLLGEDMEASTLDLEALARWQYPVFSWLYPFVDVALGASRITLDVSGENLHEWAAVVGAQGGIAFRTPIGFVGESVMLGLELSLGYTWRSSADFAEGDVDLGTLEIHGTTARLGVLVAF